MKLVAYEKSTKKSSNEYETPPELYKKLHEVFKFDLDVAAQKKTAKCGRWLGPGSKLAEDALDVSWNRFGESCWCNPPYSLWGRFARHAEYYSSIVRTVMLVPPRTDSRAFHLHMPHAIELTFLEGRVPFLLDGVVKSSPGAGSMIAVFGPRSPRASVKINFWDWRNDPYPR